MFLKKSIKSFFIVIFFVFIIGLQTCRFANAGIINIFQKDENDTISEDIEIKAYANYCVAINMLLEKRWEDAIKYLSQTLELHPNSEKAHLYIASCYFQMNQAVLAITHLQKASEINPDDFNIHYTLGTICQSNGKFDMAINEFELAIGCDFKNAPQLLYGDALFCLANLYVKKDDLDRAISCLTAIVDLKVTSEPFKIYYEIGKLQYKNGDVENAIETFKKVKDLNPFITNVYSFLASCYEIAGRFEDAINEINVLVAKSPNDWSIHLALSRIYNKMEKEEQSDNHLEKVVQILNESIDLGSKDPDEYLALSRIMLDRNDEKGASDILNKCLLFCEDKTKKRDIHFLLSTVYYELNQFDKTEEELRKTLAIDENLHQANNFLGYFYADRGYNLDEAIVLIKKALEVEPDNAAYLDSLGWAYFKKAKLEDKNDLIQLALKKLFEAAESSDDPEIQEHIGDVYYSLGKWKKAEAEWEKALEFSNNDKDSRNVKVSKRLEEKIEKLKNLRFSEKLEKKTFSKIEQGNVN